MTSEPVGSGPRLGDIPANSHRAREAAASKAPEEEPEPVQKIIEGTVVRRKLPWYKRAAGWMIAEDAGSVGDYLLADVLRPALRNLAFDLFVGSAERTLYGTARNRRTHVNGGGGGGISNKYHNVPTVSSSRAMSQEARARHDFDDVVLSNRAEGVEVIEFLIDRIERYQVARVSDLYDALGITGDFAARKWGWTDLREADLRPTRGGFLLDLPRPQPIR